MRDPPGEDLLAERVEQKGGLAVQAAAARRRHEGADEPRRDRRLEQHRRLAGGDLARAQARQRAPARVARRAPPASASLPGTRAELYQSSRCIRPRSSAITERESECREVGKPCMKPRLLANTNCACCAETVAPSELLIFGDSANAARSVAPRDADRLLGAEVPRMVEVEVPRAPARARRRSGGPAQSSTAVLRAIAAAASTALPGPPKKNRRCWRGRGAPSAARRNTP